LNPHTNYAAVGFFLLVGVAVMVVLVVWLGQAADTTPRTGYVVRIESNVNGLSNGSIVRYLGVNVGSVVDIQLYTDTRPFVDVFIEIEEGLPIDDSTYATLVSQGVTGIANIDLASDLKLARPLETHESGIPIIPFRATGLSAMLAGSGDLTTDLLRLVAQLNVLTGDENQRRVAGILTNVEEFSGALAGQGQEIPDIVASLRSAVAGLERTAKGLEVAVADDWPVIAADLKQTSGRLASISGRVDGWLAANDQSVDRLLGEGFDSLNDLVLDLREVAEQISRLSAKLREDPSRLIYRGRHDPVVAEP
jgi:phospholipid/cholesterol/gamma-HCH transport system substrate-binding protein